MPSPYGPPARPPPWMGRNGGLRTGNSGLNGVNSMNGGLRTGNSGLSGNGRIYYGDELEDITGMDLFSDDAAMEGDVIRTSEFRESSRPWRVTKVRITPSEDLPPEIYLDDPYLISPQPEPPSLPQPYPYPYPTPPEPHPYYLSLIHI